MTDCIHATKTVLFGVGGYTIYLCHNPYCGVHILRFPNGDEEVATIDTCGDCNGYWVSSDSTRGKMHLPLGDNCVPF